MALSRAEKARLLHMLARTSPTLAPGIETTPGVVGGERASTHTHPRVDVGDYRRLGWCEARILDNVPTLRAVDLVEPVAYAAAHSDEIDRAIRRMT